MRRWSSVLLVILLSTGCGTPSSTLANRQQERRLPASLDGISPGVTGEPQSTQQADNSRSASATALPRLVLQGRRLATNEGRPFVWRFATGFRLVDDVADGREAATIEFLDWLHAAGFNGARVLSSLCCWFNLSPADGRRALPRTLELAAERGIYLEVVALAGTKAGGWSTDEMRQHVKSLGEICAAAVNCAAIEIANENAHPSQNRALTDPALLQSLLDTIPSTVPVSAGSNCCGETDRAEVHHGGRYITVHGDRGQPIWERTWHLRRQHELSVSTEKYVVDDEGIGAGESEEHGRRSPHADEFFARGVLSRVLSIGVTFHFSDGLQAVRPGPVQAAAASAFIAGTRVVPDDVELTLDKEAGTSGSPIQKFTGAAHVMTATGPPNLVIALGVGPDFQMTYRAPWHTVRSVANRGDVRVLEIRR
jgi:hypothetical protein